MGAEMRLLLEATVCLGASYGFTAKADTDTFRPERIFNRAIGIALNLVAIYYCARFTSAVI